MKQFLLLMTRAAFAAGMLFALGSCSDSKNVEEPEGGGGNPPVQETTIKNIEIKVSDITKYTVNVSFTPSVDYLTFFPSLIEKSEFSKFANDAAYIQDDLDFLTQYAAYYSMTLPEIIDQLTKKGPQSHLYEKLTPGTEYVAYAFGLNTDGSVTSVLFKEFFTTIAPGASNNKITLDVSTIGPDGAIVSATTTTQDTYILDVWEAATFKDMTDDQIMDKVIDGYEDPDYWDQYISKGDDKLNVQGQLKADTDYFALAFGYEAGVKTTGLVKVPFTTKPDGWLDCSFTVTQEKLNCRAASYKVTPSDNTIPYYYSLIPASTIADDSDEAAIAQLRVAIQEKFNMGWDYNLLLFRGEKSQSYEKLTPETDYYLCIVGINLNGEIITNLKKQKVTTPAPSAATVTFGKPQISGRTVTVSVTPGAGTPKWMAINIYTKYSFYTEEYMTNHILGFEPNNQTSVTTNVPEEETAAYFYAIGYDASGNPGKLVSLDVPIE